MQASELRGIPSHAVICTASDYRLLRLTPQPPSAVGVDSAGGGGGVRPGAALVASSPQLLALRGGLSEDSLVVSARSLVCKLAAVMRSQADALGAAVKELPAGAALGDPLAGALSASCVMLHGSGL